jgi:hypothetical protein
VISLPAFLQVFKRENSAGLYSVHMYYFGNWACKMMTMGFYPVMLISIVFWQLDLDDKSMENYLLFLKVGFFQSLNALTIGHMWSCVFDEPTQALVTGFGLQNLIVSGMGIVSKPTSNKIVGTLFKIMPSSYTFELIFRRVMSKNTAKDFFLGYFMLVRGEEYCF